jgi:putative glutamine amidotransferase
MKTLITQRESLDVHGTPIDVLESDYIRYFEANGCELYPVSNFLTNVDFLFNQDIALLIITGGGSIAGKHYVPSRKGASSPRRDDIERKLFEDAVRRNIPVLAICRGMQYVNVLLGGKVSVLSGLAVDRPVGEEHPIRMGETVIMVNNYHNDGIYKSQLSTHLYPVGMDEENNVVELYRSGNHKILGLQFHPERNMQDETSKKIINELIIDFMTDSLSIKNNNLNYRK